MGKGFDENKHPRNETGKFTEGVGTKAEQEKLQQMGIAVKEKQDSNLTNEEKRLQELTGEKVEHRFTDEDKRKRKHKTKRRQWTEEERQAWNAENKELKKILNNHSPITVKIDGKDVQAYFDKFTANKNIYKPCRSDKIGFEWKRKNIQYIGKLMQNAKYWKTEAESGNKFDKNGDIKEAHRGVKQWHYLTLKPRDKKAKYNMLVNIREKNNKYYIYEIAITQRKNKKKESLSYSKLSINKK